MKVQSLSWTAFVIIVLALLATSSSGASSIWTLYGNSAGPERHLSSMGFPQVETADSSSQVLATYPAYLQFILEVGRRSDSGMAHRLETTYSTLRQKYPEAAAEFLKGLRFEMVQKLEFMGSSPQSISTSSPEMKRWVSKFMKEWRREADEYLFRAVSFRRAHT